MLEAKSARREARGEAPLDVEAELASLTSQPGAQRPGPPRGGAPARDRAQRAAARQGKEPLDVEAEVERQLRDLGG